MKKHLLLGACAVLTIPASALAQSTGAIDFEEAEIVVTGSRADRGVAGVIAPDTPKAKAVLTQELIGRQVPGQTVNEIINLVPGVSFQNDDPFGSAGGTLTIRGFDDTRISQTFDGIPLNDTGGYALYSNQQVDPEIIDQVNVNLGTTDVDSPTAAATGSTVNYRTRIPTEDFHVRAQASVGDFDFFRVFGMVDTGAFGPWGTRAFVSASAATNRPIYGRRDGQVDKQQYNAKIYQPIGDNGDFVSIAGHYNQNRNNRFGSSPLRLDADREVGPDSGNRFPRTRGERDYELESCQIPEGVSGVADPASSCGSVFDYRFNPSNTGNVRINSRFTLADNLILTVDPSYQYTKANGGGTATANEGFFDIGGDPFTGYIVNSNTSTTGTPYFGRDVNGDGDALDIVRVLAPSQTQTHRYGVIASLRYDFTEDHSLRVAYTFDRGRHRQTGEVGLLQPNGEPFQVFPINNPEADVLGNVLQKRDRLSYAILHQASGEYRGEFMDDRLVVNLGLRAPFFKRDLNQYCFTRNASGGVSCFGGDAAAETAYGAANPVASAPQQRIFKYDKLLPTAGLVFDLFDRASIFANYSKGLQVPGTDNLYQSFFFDLGTDAADPNPETTDNFDVGLRYRSGKVQAQLSGWYTIFNNRLASAYDREENVTIYRNLGRVDKYGIDGSVSYQPLPELQLYAFGSYLKSKIKDDVEAGNCTATNVTNGELGCTAVGDPAFFQTGGKRESGAPVYTFGGRAQANLGPVEIGVQAKRTGKRYYNDQNLPVVSGGTQVYGRALPAYTLVDIDARFSLEALGLNDRTFLQLNVTNVFDKLYVGGFDGTLSNSTVQFAQIGAPRTFIGTLVVGF